MADPVETCLGLTQDENAKRGPETKPTFSEYLMSLSKLTIVDILLAVFLFALIIGFIFTFIPALRPFSTNVLQIGFLGIVTFMTIKSLNQKLASDICMTCQGLNGMSYKTKLDVILSFSWATIQTYVGLVLNVMYYFVLLYMVYVLLRSHLIYDFGRTYDLTSDTRLFSLLHKNLEVHSISQLLQNVIKAVFVLIYWCLLVGVIGSVVISVIQPKLVLAVIKSKLSFIILLVLPFYMVASTLLLRFAYGRLNWSWIDMIVAHNVVPTFSHTTLTSGFNFVNRDTIKAHALVFVSSLTNSLIYSGLFLSPLTKNDICRDKGELDVSNMKFQEFKNRFLMGHYIIGLLIILSYVAAMGGSVGKSILMASFAIVLLLYIFAYIMSHKKEEATSEDA